MLAETSPTTSLIQQEQLYREFCRQCWSLPYPELKKAIANYLTQGAHLSYPEWEAGHNLTCLLALIINPWISLDEFKSLFWLLKEKGANLDVRHCEQTLLMKAVDAGCFEIAVWLIDELKVNVNEQTPIGMTALHAAVDIDNVKMAQLLLEKGADPDIPHQQHKTARDYVKSLAMRELLPLKNAISQYEAWAKARTSSSPWATLLQRFSSLFSTAVAKAQPKPAMQATVSQSPLTPH